MALDQMDYDLFKGIKNALMDIAKELHTLNESRSQKHENNSLT